MELQSRICLSHVKQDFNIALVIDDILTVAMADPLMIQVVCVIFRYTGNFPYLFSMCPVLIELIGTDMWFVLSSYRILDGNKIKLAKDSFENFNNLESL